MVNCDNLLTIHAVALGGRIGALLPEQEAELTEAISAALYLDLG